jgi:alpha-beta hydrolase superfamily lysophospholipase
MAPVREMQLSAADGTPLFVVDWPGKAAPAGPRGIMLMHGLGEHCGRYAHVAHFFNECGWSVRAYDHRGHGRSGGPRGDTPGKDAILRDAKRVFDDFAQQFAMPPLLLGHSMGGLFAARFATGALSPLSGLILSSPALAIPLSGVQKLLLKTLGAIAPGLGVPNGLQTRYLSHDPQVEQAYNKDPLVHPKITPRLLGSMLDAADFARAHASEITIPTLMVVAGDDHLVDASGSDAFFSRLKPGIGTMHRYADFYHEIFNETGAVRVFADVRNWLNAQAFGAAHQGEALASAGGS